MSEGEPSEKSRQIKVIKFNLTRDSDNSMFEEYKDLYQLTSKTVDDHIEFYKKKESLPTQELFALWKKLSEQTANFDKNDWASSWRNWHENIHAFESHKFEAKFLIQNYLTVVLEELIGRIMGTLGKYLEPAEGTKPSKETLDDELSQLIKKELRRQVKEELASQKLRTKKSRK